MCGVARVLRILLLALAAFVLLEWWSGREQDAPLQDDPVASAVELDARASGYPSFLPSEAIETLQAIGRGGPFPYARDGVVFQNRERRLPDRPRGYYREYTVRTPGASDRGARRIVTGGDPPQVYYYTDDHYQSFREVVMEQ
jgi:guanyl-specific ribonuclease Sa